MPYINVSHTFVNGTVADADEVNDNFNNFVDGLNNGLYDIKVFNADADKVSAFSITGNNVYGSTVNTLDMNATGRISASTVYGTVLSSPLINADNAYITGVNSTKISAYSYYATYVFGSEIYATFSSIDTMTVGFIFANALEGDSVLATDIIGVTVSANTGIFDRVSCTTVQATNGYYSDINTSYVNTTYTYTDYVYCSSFVQCNQISANTGLFGRISAPVINVGTISGNSGLFANVSATTGLFSQCSATSIIGNTVYGSDITAPLLSASTGYFGRISAGTGTFSNIWFGTESNQFYTTGDSFSMNFTGFVSANSFRVLWFRYGAIYTLVFMCASRFSSATATDVRMVTNSFPAAMASVANEVAWGLGRFNNVDLVPCYMYGTGVSSFALRFHITTNNYITTPTIAQICGTSKKITLTYQV